MKGTFGAYSIMRPMVHHMESTAVRQLLTISQCLKCYSRALQTVANGPDAILLSETYCVQNEKIIQDNIPVLNLFMWTLSMH